MRIHLFGSTAVPTIPELTACAFNQTLIKYAKSLKEHNHHVLLYGTKEFESDYASICDQFVPINSIDDFKPLMSYKHCEALMHWNFAYTRMPSSNPDIEKIFRFPIPEKYVEAWKKGFGPMWHDDLDSLSFEELRVHAVKAFSYGKYLSNTYPKECSDVTYKVQKINAAEGIMNYLDLIQPKDLILVFWNITYDKFFKEAEKRGGIIVEGLTGYSTHDWTLKFNRSIFSSQQEMNLRHKIQKVKGEHHYVIPPFFNTNDFIYNPESRNPKGPFLYLGRLQYSKGVYTFMQLVEAFPDYTFWMAGHGNIKDDKLYIDDINKVYNLNKLPNLKYWGIADKELRAKLLAESSALIQPSEYDEPFGWNVVEAHFSGTPTIAPNRGAFKETIINGFNGFLYEFDDISRGGSYEDWRIRLTASTSLFPRHIHDRAISLYSEYAIMTKYIQTLENIKKNSGPLYIK